MWHQSSHTKPWIIEEMDWVSKNPAYPRNNQATCMRNKHLFAKGRKINVENELEQSIRWLARQQGADWKATYRTVEVHGQKIRPCMADGRAHSFAVSHNTRKRKWESFGPRPRGLRGNGRRAQHEEWKISWKTTVHSKLHQKESLNKFVFKFLYESAKIIPFVAACSTC